MAESHGDDNSPGSQEAPDSAHGAMDQILFQIEPPAQHALSAEYYSAEEWPALQAALASVLESHAVRPADPSFCRAAVEQYEGSLLEEARQRDKERRQAEAKKPNLNTASPEQLTAILPPALLKTTLECREERGHFISVGDWISCVYRIPAPIPDVMVEEWEKRVRVSTGGGEVFALRVDPTAWHQVFIVLSFVGGTLSKSVIERVTTVIVEHATARISRRRRYRERLREMSSDEPSIPRREGYDTYILGPDGKVLRRIKVYDSEESEIEESEITDTAHFPGQ